MDSSRCPESSLLSDFVLGNLPTRAFDELAEHVANCRDCELSLVALDDVSDSLLARLRGRPSAANGEPVPQALIEVVLNAPQPTAPGLGTSIGRGATAGRFVLLEALGTGSFGSVYRARDVEFDRQVAIKILKSAGPASGEELDRFLREARSAAALKHPGIVAFYDAGKTDEGVCFLVEEFVAGQTLAARLASYQFTPRQAAELIAETADALAYAHSQGVIHRDVKPSNIMLDRATHIHLMDFGLAKREIDESSLTMDGAVLGTPAYMSPEQARGDSHHVDARSDVYSLGVILYELLAGARPFHGNRRILLLKVLEEEPVPPRQLNDRIPRDLETICLKAMAKQPARRYGTAQELSDDLRRFLAGELIRARRTGLAERAWRWCRRNPLAASLLLAVSIGSAFGFWHLSRLSESLVRSTAIEGAAQYGELLEAVNIAYSEQTERLEPAERAKILLPASLTNYLDQHIGQKSESGMHVRLYSDHPFRLRTDGGPRDEFEWQALQQLRQDATQPVYRFEDVQGRPSLRYATARVMQQTCIECHNKHPDSTKHDWKVGDVRGVVEVIRPLGTDNIRVQKGLRSTFVLVAGVSGTLLAVSVLALISGKRWRNRQSPPLGGA